VPPERVWLDLRGCSRVRPGAAWRLGSALRRVSRHRGFLEVAVPMLDDRDFSGAWYTDFTRSGLGYAIAAHASRVVASSGSDVGIQIQDYYSKHADQVSNNANGTYSLQALRDLASDRNDFYRQLDARISRIRLARGVD